MRGLERALVHATVENGPAASLCHAYRSGGLPRTGLSPAKLTAVKRVVCKDGTCPDILQSLQDEYEVTRRFTHPGLRRSLDLKRGITISGNLVHMELVMEAVDGVSLFARRPVTLKALTECFVQVASALAELHSLGYAHCNLNPNNVFLDNQGRVKITGFTCVRQRDRICGKDEEGCRKVRNCSSLPTFCVDRLHLGATMYWALTEQYVWPLAPRHADNLESSLHSLTCLNPSVSGHLVSLITDCLRPSSECCSLRMADIVQRLLALRGDLH